MRFVLLFIALFGCIPPAAFAGESIELARGVVPQHPQQPQIVVDSNAGIHVVFGVGNRIRYRRSNDGGKSFSEPVDLPIVNAMSLGMRRGPRIATAGSVLCVTAIGGKQGKGQDGDVIALRSVDGGKRWTGPTVVNDVADAAREGLHAMAGGERGILCCAWLDLRNNRTDVVASISSDGGESWGKNVLVYRSPDKSVCECCHPSVTIDTHGQIYVLWRNSLAGARDMYVAKSLDNGTSFGAAQKLGAGSWPLNGCPMDGGAIAVLSSGKVATAWRRDKTVFMTLDGEHEERRLGDGEQPWIAGTADGPFIVWLKKRGETAYLLRPQTTEPVELATHAYDPVIASAASGHGPVIAAWEKREGKDYTIQCQLVANIK